ncbi:hypothetical protein AKJ16_DCAP01020 [Drosera capensis]
MKRSMWECLRFRLGVIVVVVLVVGCDASGREEGDSRSGQGRGRSTTAVFPVGGAVYPEGSLKNLTSPGTMLCIVMTPCVNSFRENLNNAKNISSPSLAIIEIVVPSAIDSPIPSSNLLQLVL